MLPAPFRWDNDQIVADLPHARAVFSTARGGVSAGPYDSLNLGMLTEDDPAHVTENRRRLGETVGHQWPRFCYGRQVHGAKVRRATEPPSAERPYTEEDGQATALADAAAIVFVADCLPVLLAAEGAVAALHGGWRPLAGGIVEEGIEALHEVGGHGPIVAALGPGARGCCYEVGEEVHEHFATYDARRGERNLDLAAVARQQLEARDIEVLDTGVCTICSPPGVLFSHRRDKGVTGRQAGVVPRLITGLDVARVRANLERIRNEIADAGRDPAEVDILAAVKYVPLEEIGTLQEAGLTLLGENRAQDLEAKASAHPGFRWHFIGQLQSRKVKQILPFVELIHSVASESALAQLERHGAPETEILLEVNVAGETDKAGIAPSDLARYLELSPVKVVGLMTMPPFADDPEASRPHFARLRELAREHGLQQLSMGTSQDYAVAAAEGATIVRIGTTLYT